jgi:hypothetical protein
VVTGIVVALLGGRQLLIIWYARNVQREYDTALRTPPSAIQGEHLKKYERYRDTLVTLGYLEKIEINLHYIPVPSTEAKMFWRLINERFPQNIHTKLRGYGGVPPQLVVWDRAGRIPEWQRFVAEFDVPDYQARLSSALKER